MLGIVLLLVLGACGNKESQGEESKKLKVVTTFYPM